MRLNVALVLVFCASLRAQSTQLPIFEPGPANTFDETAVKDPSIVFAGGKWHLFYTARGRKQYSLGYASAKRLEDLRLAPHRQLIPAYAAAPQVFFFRPQNLWYLIYQTTTANYQPVYATTKTIDDPTSWSSPKPLVTKTDNAKWIDFWIICDDRQAVLFYTREHRDVVAMTTSLSSFPNNFANPRTVYTGVHEAVHVYRDKQNYALLFELRNEDGSRKFGLAESTKLLGPWTTIEGWTVPASHGELLRTGIDQRLEADVHHTRFLIQQLPESKMSDDYPELPWHLTLIKSH
jgi:hypothetical protein